MILSTVIKRSSEMYTIQNAHGRYHEGKPTAYSWSTNLQIARNFATAAVTFKKENKVRGRIVKLDI
nr:MAG TPA: hypothetical protein [Caudoviricetes sp.]